MILMMMLVMMMIMNAGDADVYESPLDIVGG